MCCRQLIQAGKFSEIRKWIIINMLVETCFSTCFLEKEMVTHSSILARRIPWKEEPGGLQFMGSQRVGHN